MKIKHIFTTQFVNPNQIISKKCLFENKMFNKSWVPSKLLYNLYYCTNFCPFGLCCYSLRCSFFFFCRNLASSTKVTKTKFLLAASYRCLIKFKAQTGAESACCRITAFAWCPWCLIQVCEISVTIIPVAQGCLWRLRSVNSLPCLTCKCLVNTS